MMMSAADILKEIDVIRVNAVDAAAEGEADHQQIQQLPPKTAPSWLMEPEWR